MPVVGGEVDAFCTRCKMILAHTVLAMVGTKVARVRCNTCMGDHAFRGDPGARSAPSTTTRAPRATKEDKLVISFEEQLRGKDIASAARYSPRTTFAVDQVVSHPTFGLGIVRAVRGDKIDVAFKADQKTLIHGKGGEAAEKPTYQAPPASASGPSDKPQASEE